MPQFGKLVECLEGAAGGFIQIRSREVFGHRLPHQLRDAAPGLSGKPL